MGKNRDRGGNESRGRGRGGHGGNNVHGGRINKNRDFNKTNSHNNNQKFCEFHQWNNTHNTKECKTGKNENNRQKNQQNDSKKNRERDNNARNHDGTQKQGGAKTFCTRCGYTNHMVQTCSAKMLPEEDWCECGCEYHKTSSQCIWNCDEEERLASIAAATSKICQWCKADGDGAHSFEDCPLPIKFRRDLRKRIEDTYNNLMWCWHCSSEDHKTRGCVKQNAQLGKDKWNHKISEIISDWRHEDVVNANDRYDFEDEEMENEFGGVLGTKAPVAHDPRFAWCLFCEEFGHVGPQPVCDRTEYERRRPTGVIDRGIERTFAPKTLTWAKGVKEAPAFSGGPSSSSRGTLNAQCIMVGCRQVLAFHRELPALGQVIICPRCKTSNSHPSALKRGSASRSLYQIAEWIGSLGSPTKLSSPTKRFIRGILNLPLSPDQEETPEDYRRRPSSLITRNVWSRLPETQPLCKDTGERLRGTKAPFFKENGRFYNEPGNHQHYFPATKIRVVVEDQLILEDDELPINRAGRRGQVPMCATCGVPGNVYDDEFDIVMCGTDPANTLCYGKGWEFWSPWKRQHTSWDTRCDCLVDIMGQTPNPVWVASM